MFEEWVRYVKEDMNNVDGALIGTNMQVAMTGPCLICLR
jgi:hypothetical protein